MFNNRIDFLNKFFCWVRKDDFYVLKTYQLKQEISLRQLIVTGGRGYNKWAYLKCPCGCQEIINLSLMGSHPVFWTLKIDSLSRPSLHPSIWKKEGCQSHFWIINGRIKWCTH